MSQEKKETIKTQAKEETANKAEKNEWQELELDDADLMTVVGPIVGPINASPRSLPWQVGLSNFSLKVGEEG